MKHITTSSPLAMLGGKPACVTPTPDWPVFGREEEQALLEVLHSGKWWYGDRVRAFEEAYAAFHDARYGISCCNGSVALEVLMRSMGIGAGDEVLVPAYTFIASATSVLMVNARPVFVDVNEMDFNLNLEHAESLITEKTRALMVVHFAGLPIDLDAVRAFADKHKLRVIEDAAHAWGSQWKGVGVGTQFEGGTFSFQVSKNITAGEGGIIITNNKDTADLARSLTHCGRTLNGAWYEHRHIGGNYRLTEFQAAILLQQLARLEAQTRKREENAAHLNTRLAEIPGIHLQQTDARVTRRSYHLYMFRFVAEEFGHIDRDIFIRALEAEGVPASPGYLSPVYGNRCFQELRHVPGLRNCLHHAACAEAAVDYSRTHCPVAERLCSAQAVWLPHALLLGDQEQMRAVAAAIEKIYQHREALATATMT